MPRSVLVVDDDASFRDLAARVLVGWGHAVIGEAGSVEEALARAAELRPDTALVDIGLPDGDGFGLAQQLRALPWPLRVVLISTDARSRQRARRRRARARAASSPRTSWPERAPAAHRGALRAIAAAALRVVIGEDDVLLREGIARILTAAGLDVVAQAGDADDLLRRTLAHRPDVAIIDVQMPPRHEDDGLVAASSCGAVCPRPAC